MARLSDSFGAILDSSSVGRIKALSVLKLPSRINTYSGEKIILTRSVRTPIAVSYTFGKVTLQLKTPGVISNTSGKVRPQSIRSLPNNVSNTSGKVLPQSIKLAPDKLSNTSGKFYPKFDKLIESSRVVSYTFGKVTLQLKTPGVISNTSGKVRPQSIKLAPDKLSNTFGKVLPQSIKFASDKLSNTSGKVTLQLKTPGVISNTSGKVRPQSIKLAPDKLSYTSGNFYPKFDKLIESSRVSYTFGKVTLQLKTPGIVFNTFGKVTLQLKTPGIVSNTFGKIRPQSIKLAPDKLSNTFGKVLPQSIKFASDKLSNTSGNFYPKFDKLIESSKISYTFGKVRPQSIKLAPDKLSNTFGKVLPQSIKFASDKLSNTSGKVTLQLKTPGVIFNTSGKVTLQLKTPGVISYTSGNFYPKFDKLIESSRVSYTFGKVLPQSIRSLPNNVSNAFGKTILPSVKSLPNNVSNAFGKTILPSVKSLPNNVSNAFGKTILPSVKQTQNILLNTSGNFYPKFDKLIGIGTYDISGKVLPQSIRSLPNNVSNSLGKTLPKAAAFCDVQDRRSLFKQKNYTPDNNYDFSVGIISQSLDSSTISYTVNSIFTENNFSESYILDKKYVAPSSTKTLYFQDQGRIRFEIGDTVRIRNINNLYSELVVVTNTSFNSISYSSNNLIPEISGTFIDSGTTLYKFLTYNKETAGTSAKNLFTSIMAPGKRGTLSNYSAYGEIVDLRKLPNKLSNISVLKNDGNTIAYRPSIIQPFKTSVILVPDFRSVSKVTFPNQTFKETFDLRKSFNKLSNISVLKNDGNKANTYVPNKLQQVKTTFIAPVIDVRSTLYLGRMSIPLKDLTYNIQLNSLNKKFTVLKTVNDNLRNLQKINVSKFTGPILSLPQNTGLYKINSYRASDSIQLKNVSTINKPLHKLNADRISLSVNMLQKSISSLKGLADDFYVSKSNYVRSYRSGPLMEVKFVATPNKILISLKSVETNYKAQTIQKRHTTVKSVRYDVKPSFLILPIKAITIPNYNVANINKGFVVRDLPKNITNINNISANIRQSSVSTTTRPTNARENLYYVNLAPGIRNKATYTSTSSYQSTDKNYNVANISANISQSSVSTTVSPTNARENLYYSILAPGLRQNAFYNTTTGYASLNSNRDIANISANISQSSVSTTVSPINARENLYYSILAPGLRRNALYNTTSSYVNIENQYSLANISESISQSSVSTTVSPINARENLFYSILAPGLRRNALYNTTTGYASAENFELRNINVFTVKSFYKDLPIQFGIEKLSFYSPFNNLNLSEISIQITGQNLDSSINRYTIDSIFTENNLSESYLWNKQSVVSSLTKTLYFPNQLNQKFFAGDVVKIRNSNSSYVDYVYVISATANSVTYTSSNLVPEISGTFIESGTTVYSKLLSTTIGPNPLKNFNISVATPGRNATKSFGYGPYSAASSLEVVSPYNIRKQIQSLSKGDVQLDFATKIRSITTLKKDPNSFDVTNLNIQKIKNVQQFDLPSNYATNKLNSITRFKDIPTSFVVNNLKRYDIDSSGNPPDFTLAIIDQSLNQFSNYYNNTETIFIENAPTNGYIWGSINRVPSTQQPTSKTLYFANQRKLIFDIGEKVRVRNATTGRSTFETVVGCTFSSVTISLPSIPITEIANTFIDSGFTTYQQNFVKTSSAPINARERFYYSKMAQGYKSTNIYSLGTSYSDTPSLNNTTFKLPYTNTVPRPTLKPAYAKNYENTNFIVKFKTGDFKRGSNGIADPAAIKKAPIQFWS